MKKVTAWGTGNPSRKFLYIRDAAREIVAAAEKYGKHEPWNPGSGEEIRIRDLVTIIKEMTGYEGAVECDTSRPDSQPRRSLDVSRAEKEIGFRAATLFRDGLEETNELYKESLIVTAGEGVQN